MGGNIKKKFLPSLAAKEIVLAPPVRALIMLRKLVSIAAVWIPSLSYKN